MWKVLVAVASVVTERVVTAPRKQARATQAEVSMPGSHTRLWRRLWRRFGVDASDNNSEDFVDETMGGVSLNGVESNGIDSDSNVVNSNKSNKAQYRLHLLIPNTASAIL